MDTWQALMHIINGVQASTPFHLYTTTRYPFILCIYWLIKQYDWNKHFSRSSVINLPDKHLYNSTVTALGYYLSFFISDRGVNYIDIPKEFSYF